MLNPDFVPPSAGRKGHKWRVLRQQCFERDMRRNAVCWLCHCPINYAAEPGQPDAWEPDHIQEVDQHPELAYDPMNIAPAHSRCNRIRGAEYLAAKKHREDCGEPSEDWGL